jgi:hypothetical protein
VRADRPNFGPVSGAHEPLHIRNPVSGAEIGVAVDPRHVRLAAPGVRRLNDS